MKLTAAKKISTLFAVALFALACPTNAMPPVPRTFKGGVERIDMQARELVITNRHDRATLTWKPPAELRGPCLKPGDFVKAYYRKEVGSYVVSDLSILSQACCCK